MGRLRKTVVLLLIAGSLVSLSCKKREPGFAIETSDGVRIVRNLAPKPGKAYRSPGLAEDISIGGDDAAGNALLARF
jgi:hypothetical protein